MKFVKSFIAETPKRLEEQVNNWIVETGINLSDIQFFVTPDGCHVAYIVYFKVA